jgi:hypothetical protein
MICNTQLFIVLSIIYIGTHSCRSPDLFCFVKHVSFNTTNTCFSVCCLLALIPLLPCNLPTAAFSPDLQAVLQQVEGWELVSHDMQLDYQHFTADAVLRVRTGSSEVAAASCSDVASVSL